MPNYDYRLHQSPFQDIVTVSYRTTTMAVSTQGAIMNRLTRSVLPNVSLRPYPVNHLFVLVPSGRRYGASRTRTNRFSFIFFFPQPSWHCRL